MQLRFNRFDGRSRNDIGVIDQDTGANVGLIHCGGSGRKHELEGGISGHHPLRRSQHQHTSDRAIAGAALTDRSKEKSNARLARPTGGRRTGRLGGIHVSLFGGKYAASLNTYDECVGFILGVQEDLNALYATERVTVSN
jgi:hypothetical protein